MRNHYTDRGDHYAIELWWRSSAKKTYGEREQLYALIDKADLPIVAAIKGTWRAVASGRTHYARWVSHQNHKNVLIWMHRLIVDCPAELEPDHGNHDGLDNRRFNLAIVTHSYNVSSDRRRPRTSTKPRATLCGRCKREPRQHNHSYCVDCKLAYEQDRRARLAHERNEARKVRNYLNPS